MMMTDTKSGERRVAGSATSTPTATVAAACGVGRSDGAGNGSYESNSQNDLCNHGVVEEVTGFDELDSDEEDFKEVKACLFRYLHYYFLPLYFLKIQTCNN